MKIDGNRAVFALRRMAELEAVCRSEAQRVIFALRGNKRYGNRSWRDLEAFQPLQRA